MNVGILDTLSRKNGRLTDEGISEMFRRFVQGQLGIRCTAHQLRHTVATWLINAEAKPELLQVLLGHQDLRTTMRYAKVNANRVRGLVDQLPATSGWHEHNATPSPPGMTLEGMQFLSHDPAS
ncbi:MAG: tyrosine-type recombinase/integrase [Oscillochloridaceae bacterium umkhey_bin13]